MQRETRIQYGPEFGDGTPNGVRDGRPTRENWQRAVTPKHPDFTPNDLMTIRFEAEEKKKLKAG